MKAIEILEDHSIYPDGVILRDGDVERSGFAIVTYYDVPMAVLSRLSPVGLRKSITAIDGGWSLDITTSWDTGIDIAAELGAVDLPDDDRELLSRATCWTDGCNGPAPNDFAWNSGLDCWSAVCECGETISVYGGER